MTSIIKEPTTKKFKITLLSGLHIGGSNAGLKIGGIDSPVIKNPITGAPYIPGSSIKGKMRASLEMIEGQYNEKDFGPSIDFNHEIPRAFGMTTKDIKISSRIIFSDFEMTDKWKSTFESLGTADFFEAKSENSVPRFLKGNANPRQIERVPAGVEFEGIITLLPVEGSDDVYPISQDKLEKILTSGIKYVEMFGLGGGVSRGSGRVKISQLES